MWNYDVEFAGSSAESHGIYVVRRPDIPAPMRSYTEYTIPKRGGIMYADNGVHDDIAISVDFNFMGVPNEWFSLFRNAKKWLLEPGMKKLVFGDDRDYFYRVKKVEIETAERVCYEIGRFTAEFFCEGCQFRADGDEYYDAAEVLYNPYDISVPVYKITGEGFCTLNVNGKTMTVNVGQNVIIDTGLHISYRQNEVTQNTEVTGWYEDLYLLSGNNTISCTNGFGIKVKPNWRCV